MADTGTTTPPTTAQLRDDIDSGRTGEKVGWPDPAAAPLGTDAEAGGQSTGPEARMMEQRDTGVVTPTPHRHGWRGAIAYAVVAVAVLAVIAAIALLA